MLKHEDNPQPQTPSPSAAQVRVTPEELAAAVTALQIRKEGQPGTIAIGDAVDELGLDLTPGEILAEVQAGRIKQRYLKKQPSKRGQRFVLALGLAGVLLGLSVDGNGLSQMWREQAVSSSSVGSDLTRNGNLTLDRVPDEQQAYVDTAGLDWIIERRNPALVRVYPDNAGIRWGIIKHQGQVYVQGYTGRSTEKELTSKFSGLSNSTGFDYSGTPYPTIKVTLPIEGLHVGGGSLSSKGAFIDFSGARTDNHLWDGFPDNFVR